MSDQIYNNLPNDLVTIIAHQEIRNELLKTLAYDIFTAKDMSKIDETTRENLIAKCHSLLEEWMSSKNPKVVAKIPYADTAAMAAKTIGDFIAGEKTNIAAIFVKLNEIAYTFQLEMERKYGQ